MQQHDNDVTKEEVRCSSKASSAASASSPLKSSSSSLSSSSSSSLSLSDGLGPGENEDGTKKGDSQQEAENEDADDLGPGNNEDGGSQQEAENEEADGLGPRKIEDGEKKGGSQQEAENEEAEAASENAVVDLTSLTLAVATSARLLAGKDSGNAGLSVRETRVVFVSSLVILLNVVLMVVVGSCATSCSTFVLMFAISVDSLTGIIWVGCWFVHVCEGGRPWFGSVVNRFDTFLVWFTFISCAVFIPVSLHEQPAFVQSSRVMRIFKGVILIARSPSFRTVCLAGASAQKALAAIIFILMFVVFISALIAMELFGNNVPLVDNPANPIWHFQHGVLTASLEMLRFMNKDGAMDHMELIGENNPWSFPFFYGFTAVTAYVLMNLVTALIVQQAIKLDRELAADPAEDGGRSRLKNLLEAISTLTVDADRTWTLAELANTAKTDEIGLFLENFEIDKEDLRSVFELVQAEGRDVLTLHQIVEVDWYLKSKIDSRDLRGCILTVQTFEERLNSYIHVLKTQRHECLGPINTSLDVIERQLHGRLDSVEDQVKLLKGIATEFEVRIMGLKSQLPPSAFKLKVTVHNLGRMLAHCMMKSSTSTEKGRLAVSEAIGTTNEALKPLKGGFAWKHASFSDFCSRNQHIIVAGYQDMVAILVTDMNVKMRQVVCYEVCRNSASYILSRSATTQDVRSAIEEAKSVSTEGRKFLAVGADLADKDPLLDLADGNEIDLVLAPEHMPVVATSDSDPKEERADAQKERRKQEEELQRQERDPKKREQEEEDERKIAATEMERKNVEKREEKIKMQEQGTRQDLQDEKQKELDEQKRLQAGKKVEAEKKEKEEQDQSKGLEAEKKEKEEQEQRKRLEAEMKEKEEQEQRNRLETEKKEKEEHEQRKRLEAETEEKEEQEQRNRLETEKKEKEEHEQRKRLEAETEEKEEQEQRNRLEAEKKEKEEQEQGERLEAEKNEKEEQEQARRLEAEKKEEEEQDERRHVEAKQEANEEPEECEQEASKLVEAEQQQNEAVIAAPSVASSRSDNSLGGGTIASSKALVTPPKAGSTPAQRRGGKVHSKSFSVAGSQEGQVPQRPKARSLPARHKASVEAKPDKRKSRGASLSKSKARPSASQRGLPVPKMTPLASTAAPARAVAPALPQDTSRPLQITVGSKVMVVNLQSAPAFNNSMGTCNGFNEEKGRYCVILTDSKEKKWLKLQNLQLID
eukprot:TRINITY_DN16472_c0_g1_i1.p1 TRINITY_DN16472_c0_g1~~TRINITY_DN16472_c0_g1_i1.p1  ORF type:complete len:1214 (+),score=324.16 TRINITY_DN16472_c0_g1_i1:106-3747(+)